MISSESNSPDTIKFVCGCSTRRLNDDKREITVCDTHRKSLETSPILFLQRSRKLMPLKIKIFLIGAIFGLTFAILFYGIPMIPHIVRHLQ